MILAAVFALLLAQQDPGATVHGQVRSELTGQPIAGAVVEIRSPESSRRAMTGSDGSYALRNVSAGRRVVRATYLGYEPLELEVAVSPGAELVLDLSLRLRPVTIEGIVVTGTVLTAIVDSVPARRAALGIAGMRALETGTPGIAELGLGDTYRGSPGQGPIDPSDVLYVRGAPADLKLVLLDGAPVYTPFHVAGLLESFETDMLGSATLHLGGAPARYDGGLSYIMELNTRSGRSGKPRGSGAVDLMSARATVDGALGERVRYLGGGRTVHGLGVSPWVGGGFPYTYEEGLLRFDADLGGGSGLSLTAFRNGEGVAIDSLDAVDRRAAWGNTAVSTRYRGRVGQNSVEVTAAYGGFEASLPIVQTDAYPTWGSTERFRVTTDVARGGGDVLFRFGVSFDHIELRHRVSATPDPLQEWETATAGQTSGAYAEATWQAAPRLRLRGGARADYYGSDASARFAPRISATWMVGERAALTAAAGRYHQYVRTVSPRWVSRLDGTADTIFLASGLAVGEANHFNLSLHQELDDEMRLGVEGFFKSFEGRQAVVDPAYSSGVDVWVRKESGRYRGWLGYSLSWVWSVTAPGSTSDAFAGRQLLNAGISGPLGRFADLDARVAYGAGLPFTAIPTDVSAPNFVEAYEAQRLHTVANTGSATDTPLLPGAPSSAFLRLDFGISRSFGTQLNGRRMAIAPYAKVLNSLNRRDGLFYWYDRRDDADPRPVAALPVVPIVGLSWVF